MCRPYGPRLALLETRAEEISFAHNTTQFDRLTRLQLAYRERCAKCLPPYRRMVDPDLCSSGWVNSSPGLVSIRGSVHEKLGRKQGDVPYKEAERWRGTHHCRPPARPALPALDSSSETVCHPPYTSTTSVRELDPRAVAEWIWSLPRDVSCEQDGLTDAHGTRPLSIPLRGNTNIPLVYTEHTRPGIGGLRVPHIFRMLSRLAD